jgi:hypothetical protein
MQTLFDTLTTDVSTPVERGQKMAVLGPAFGNFSTRAQPARLAVLSNHELLSSFRVAPVSPMSSGSFCCCLSIDFTKQRLERMTYGEV